jgi:ABC-type Na+ efflux pump permease subunit
MEILAETHKVEEYWFFLIASGIGSLIILTMITVCIINIIKNKNNKVWGFVIFLSILLISPTVGFINTLKEGVKEEYKVIINDFNELYKNGYEVIGQEGKIFTVEKK